MLSRAFFATLSGWGAYAVLIQPDLALIVTALALVADRQYRLRLVGTGGPGDSAALPFPRSASSGPTAGCRPAGPETVPHLILLSQPRR